MRLSERVSLFGSYFSICGRGEVGRLIAAAGEVQLEDKAWAPAFDETGGWRQGYQAIGEGHGFPGTMPVLEHGETKVRDHRSKSTCAAHATKARHA